jgi:TnpA family transposase
MTARPKAEAEAAWPRAGALLTRKVDAELISEHWDVIPHLPGSIKFGQATASLVVGKLSVSTRQNTMAAALKKYGALRRTVYAARYLSSEPYRRRITRALNKGEPVHACPSRRGA